MTNLDKLVYIITILTVLYGCTSSDDESDQAKYYIHGECKVPILGKYKYEMAYDSDCRECICKRCPDKVRQCNADCFKLLYCMENNRDCEEDPAKLTDCMENSGCDEYKSGLEGAQNIADCIYNLSEVEDENSCIYLCHFGYGTRFEIEYRRDKDASENSDASD